MGNTLDQIFESSMGGADYARSYANYLCQLLEELDYESVAQVMDIFCAARERGSRIFFLGNGGSASTASHFANDFAIGTRLSVKPFKAVSLTDNNSILTALGNDEGYENIFVKQLEVYLEPEDVVVVISASGNSPNLVEAVEFANKRYNPTVALVGFDGGKLKQISGANVHIETPKGDYGPCEDLHMILDHLMASFLYRWAREDSQEALDIVSPRKSSKVVNL